MKRLLLILSILVLSVIVMAQAPQQFSYQALIRDAENEIVSNRVITLQVSIITTNGDVVYSETHQTATNENGVVSVAVGSGSTTDDFSQIDWSIGDYYMQTTIDLGAGEQLVSGNSPLLSVPYAFYAEKAGNAVEVDLTDYAKKSDIPEAVDLSGYALKSEIPAEVNLSEYIPKEVFDSVANRLNDLVNQIILCENKGKIFYSINELAKKGLEEDNSLVGLFSVGSDKKVKFSKGCIYKNDSDEYLFTDEQYERGNKFESAITVDGWNNLSPEEWEYLIEDRPRATDLRSLAKVNDVNGFVILPDDWVKPWGISYIATLSESDQNVYDTSQWLVMQTSGAVFFPSRCTNLPNYNPPVNPNQNGFWTSSAGFYYGIGTDGVRINRETTYPQYIRLVKYVE